MVDAIVTGIVLVAVGYMLYRQHKLDRSEAAPPRKSGRQPDPNDTRDWPAIVAKAAELARLQQKPCIALDIVDEPVGPDAHSSIGGRPSLPSDMQWPVDENGKPMIFLAQLNFAELPQLKGYPDTGLLSFFVQDEDIQGCAFPSIGDQGFKALYHRDTKKLERHPVPDQPADYVPMSRTLAAEGRPLQGRAAMGPLTNNGMEVAEMTKGWYPDCPTDLWDQFADDLLNAKPAQIYIGGHPDFIQYDIRSPKAVPDYTAYTEVLLQMGFVYNKDRDIEVCWGDAGEACFLITKEDLAARRFDRVAYSWDCS